MNDKLVSVIITTHNRKPQIVLRAVNIVFNQTYKNIELIVVDDSTSDYPYRSEVKQSVCDISDSILYIDHKRSKSMYETNRKV
jgi:glycosyltransferase involved in cell wall biosynthesis